MYFHKRTKYTHAVSAVRFSASVVKASVSIGEVLFECFICYSYRVNRDGIQKEILVTGISCCTCAMYT